MNILFFLAIVAFIGSEANPTLSAEHQWENYKLLHGKSYSNTAEESRRFGIFLDNVRKINEHNALYDQGLVSYRLKVNKFADSTAEELRNKYTGYRKASANIRDAWPAIHILEYQPTGKNVPDTVDWRQSGAVTGVKTQGDCGSCWSFSSTGALEGQLFFKTGQLISISEQNLMDCSTDDYGNEGCDGGDMYGAFTYVFNNQGIDSESFYPYEAVNGLCRYDVAGNVTSVNSILYIQEGDEAGLKEFVSEKGPISVAMDAQDDLYAYDSGVYFHQGCSTTDLNHAVLLVGYGTENGQDYWLIKNSWDETWGEQGYIKIARNRNNNCGIATEALIPIL